MMNWYFVVQKKAWTEKGFCNLVDGYKKINEQNNIVRESKGVEYTSIKTVWKQNSLKKPWNTLLPSNLS